MSETVKQQYDLEERTMVFAANVRNFIRRLPKTLTNREDASQLTRSSGSIGANYIEANEALGKKVPYENKNISQGSQREQILVEINFCWHCVGISE